MTLNSWGQESGVIKKLACSDIGQEILSDSTLNLWNYPDLKPKDYYCLGKYFADWDLKEGQLIIQTYGDLNGQDPCILCNYERLGIIHNYHFDIIEDKTTQFIEGYNSISKSRIKERFGSDIFNKLESKDSNFVSPKDFIESILEIKASLYTTTELINDSTMLVKLNLDSVADNFGLDLSPLTFEILPISKKREKFTIDYRALKENGVRIYELRNERYFLKLRINFGDLNSICFCEKFSRHYNLTIPLTVKK